MLHSIIPLYIQILNVNNQSIKQAPIFKLDTGGRIQASAEPREKMGEKERPFHYTNISKMLKRDSKNYLIPCFLHLAILYLFSFTIETTEHLPH